MNKILNIVKFFLLFISFYLFSRLTVDDAFISWRYGKNLVDYGIWNYNPSYFDLTQAYTNPIYAYLSVIPNYLNFNVVLFFKFFSIITTSLFLYYFFYKKIKLNNFPSILILFLATPATMFHIFGGMETFLFVILSTLLFIFLYKNNLIYSCVATLLLFYIRPETYTLILLVPLFFLFAFKEESIFKIKLNKIGSIIVLKKKNIINSVKIFFILSIFLIPIFLINYYYFGYLWPNPYYVKVTSFFRPSELIRYLFFIMPALYLLYIGRLKLFILIILFFIPMGWVYSNSNLMMNYHGRFLFHIYAPIFLFILYLTYFCKDIIYYKLNNSKKYNKINQKFLIRFFLLPFVLLFLFYSSFEFRYTMTYYPRLLDAHGKLGNIIKEISNREDIKSISIGDAGLLPYNSGLNSLDSLKLGSSYLAHNGIDYNIISKYNPKILIFHTKPSSGDVRKNKSQNLLLKWAEEKNYVEVCNVVMHPQYKIKIYAFKQIKEIQNVCKISKKKNNFSHNSYFIKTFYVPPFVYWR